MDLKKIDVLDLIIQTLKEHERELDRIVYRFEELLSFFIPNEG